MYNIYTTSNWPKSQHDKESTCEVKHLAEMLEEHKAIFFKDVVPTL